jgi:hypothetical protein
MVPLLHAVPSAGGSPSVLHFAPSFLRLLFIAHGKRASREPADGSSANRRAKSFALAIPNSRTALSSRSFGTRTLTVMVSRRSPRSTPDRDEPLPPVAGPRISTPLSRSQPPLASFASAATCDRHQSNADADTDCGEKFIHGHLAGTDNPRRQFLSIVRSTRWTNWIVACRKKSAGSRVREEPDLNGGASRPHQGTGGYCHGSGS